jgi:two-component system chemotaxis sensor kinase CheA
MDTTALSRDIQELSLELLLADQTGETESLASALQKLSSIVQRAAEGGAQNIASEGKKIMASIETAGQPVAPERALPLLLAGLKSLEGNLAATEEEKPRAAARPPAVESDSLGQDPELLQDFVLEAREHLGVVETQLLVLEQNPEDTEPTNACFRAIHTIKGVAGFLDLAEIREVSHEGETLMDEVRNGRIPVTPLLIDALLQTADFLRVEVDAVEAGLLGREREAASDPEKVIEVLRAVRLNRGQAVVPAADDRPVEAGEAAPVTEDMAAVPATPSETRSVASAATAEAPAAEPGPASKQAAKQSKGPSATAARSVKVDMEKLDYLADMVGELVVTQSMLRPEGSSKAAADSPMMRNLAQLARITAEVQKTTMSMRMVPVGQLFQRLSRLVRDVSRQVGKSIELEVTGEEIELDRSIVEELADPLMHMVRNSIDHGIETPEQRKTAGKKPAGLIQLKARHEAGQVHIEITDDGRGLDRKKILNKAIQKGLVAPDASLSDSEILGLIFEAGFSTAEKVTDLSGRGVGMDVVRKQIQKLRGRVDLASTFGQGTQFLLRLPLTLAIIDGLVVRLGADRYIVPLGVVREVLRPTQEMIYTVEGHHEMLMVREHLMPLVRLDDWIGSGTNSRKLNEGIVIVIEAHGKAYALLVDDLLGKQEVVIKSLGELIQNVRGIAGAAILGDGRVGLILDPDAIVRRLHD